MGIKQELDSLLSKKMDRQEFIKHVGVGVIAVTGVAGIVKTLGNLGHGTDTTVKPPVVARRGYGNQGYGSKIKIS